ncbi:MAG: metalloregulator ArsR/SmtB family transcription factor [candidate division Zixibacteria bacterium]|nr:metalloregulator ArsR/SmtB family transcription factor [candidate division Zixibacteria bacterium]
MREFVAIAKALNDEHRVRALLALRRRELCLCQLVELLELAPSTVSKHMTILRQAGLVEGRKDGRWMYYRCAGPKAPAAVRRGLAWVYESLNTTLRAKQDLSRLKKIMESNPTRLCQQQKGK